MTSRKPPLRPRKRLIAAMIATAVASALALAGCSASGSNGGDDGKSQTVVWYVQKTPTLTSALYQKVATAFEKANPGMHVKIIDQGGQEVGAYYQTLLKTGNAPDLGNGIALTSSTVKLFKNLSSYDWVKSLVADDSVVKSYEYNGQVRMVPVGNYLGGVVFYNKDLFKKAGITSTPTSIKELDADAAKLKAIGATPIGISGDWALATAIHTVARPSIIEKTSNWYQQVSDGKASFASSPYEKALATVSDWIKDGDVRSDALGLKYEVVSNDFITGKYGMYPMGSFLIGNVAQVADPADIGVFAMPTYDGTKPAPLVVSGAMSWTVPAQAKNPEGGAKLLQFLATNKTAIATLLKPNGAWSKKVSYPQSALAGEAQALIQKGKIEMPFGSGSNYELPGLSTQLATVAAGLFTGAGTPTSIANDMDTWWKQNKPAE